MVRIQLRYAKSHMHLAGALLSADGQLVAGAGTTLTQAVAQALMRQGFRSVEVVEGDQVADWEEDKDLERALADLDTRLAGEPPDPTLQAIKDALRRHLLSHGSPARERES